MMVLRTTANSLFQQQQQQRQTGLYGVIGEEMLSSSSCNLEEDLNTSHAENQHHHTQNLLYNLTMLREKLHQVENLLLMRPLSHGQDTTATAASTAAAVIQEIMVTASSMIFSCQQMALNASMIHNTTTTTANDSEHHHLKIGLVSGMGGDGFYKDGHSNKTDTNDNSTTTTNNNNKAGEVDGGINSNGNKSKALNNRGGGGGGGGGGSGGGGGGGGGGDFFSSSTSAYDIIELDAGDLLAENSHYCHICGKGFKRDANLRMHMRAHGDEYKSNAALTKPPPPPPLPPRRCSSSGSAYEEYAYSQFLINLPRKYSCPQEGCRWNKKHAKFQPLKSMICVKNHYKRSHCPKMYVCNRCNRKKFSVLSDLRTHEKHCGDLKWRCSCGTTFSRKDKLLGHLALFVGHAPATQPIT